MSEIKKVADANVQAMIEELKKNPSNRFSKNDYQALVYSVLADKNFKPKKYLVRNDQVIEDDMDINGGMYKFLDKVLKHAGVNEASERNRILETFEYGPKDIDWVIDAVDEATWLYTECGKNMRMFRAKMLQMTIQKIVRTGKFDGRITYKKKVVDRMLEMQKRKAAENV